MHTYPTMEERGRGFALVEAIVSAAILSSVLAFSVGAYLLSAKTANMNGASVEATYLADEGVEALRVLRDSGWSANIAPLSVGSVYYLAWTGSSWSATTTNAYIDNAFERTFVLSDVYRDANGDIAPSGTLDSNTREVTVTVSWQQQGAITSQSLSAYLTNFRSN